MKTKSIKFSKNISADNLTQTIGWLGNVPACPLCGNTEMNFYLSKQRIWKCSKAHLHGVSSTMDFLLKNVA